MKKILSLALMAAVALTAAAQPQQGTLSLQPKVGASIARISGDEARFKAGLAAGIDASYQFNQWLALDAGVHYVQQGVKADVPSQATGLTTELEIDTEYLTVPILARFYVWRGLSLGAGVQPGILTKATGKLVGQEADAKDGFNSFDISIPLSIAYELPFGLVAEARYCAGLANCFKRKYTNLSGYKVDKNHNQVFEFTLGYKFKL